MRLLVLTQRLPYAPNRGDRLRAYHMLKHLRGRAEVELVSLAHDEEERRHAASMGGLAARVSAVLVPRLRNRVNAVLALAGTTPLTHLLLDAPRVRAVLREIVNSRRPDVVLAYGSGMARFAVEPPLDAIPLVVDFVDMDSVKWRDLAAAGRPPLSWIYRREAKTLRVFEEHAAMKASASLVVNDRELQIAKQIAPSANIRVLSNGVEIERLRPPDPPIGRSQVVFCGVLNYAPNHDGMMWFVREVWPAIVTERPDATLAIVGSDPQRALTTLCAAHSNITVTGRVPEVTDYLWASAVAIAPLHVARGVQNKVLEAIAAGLPVVVTDAVAGGLPTSAAPAIAVSNSPTTFAQAVVDLLGRSPADRRAIAASADLSGITWARTLDALGPLLDAAAQAKK